MIIPVVKLPSVGDTGLASDDIEALTSRLAVLSEIFLCGSGDAVAGVNPAKPYKSLLWTCDCRVGPFDVLAEDHDESTTKTVVAWLDSGARRAVLKVDVSKPDSVSNLADWTPQLPASRHRLVAAIQAGDVRAGEGGIAEEALRTAMEGLRPVVGCVQVDFGVDDYDLAPKIMSELKTLRGKEGASDYVELVFTKSGAAQAASAPVAPVGTGDMSTPPWSPEEIGRLHREFSVDVQCSASLELLEDGNSGGGIGSAVDAAGAFLSCVRTDRPDGLMTTVVCDTTGVALGLVYSNPVSVRASLESRRGVYWSRSRGGLWRKGDTSGAWQELRRLSLDCDSDALRFTVVQHGNPPAFCHFNRRNCWESERGLGHLERTLAKRKEEAPEGSYTKRLFEDPGLLRNKLVEEAQELAEASTKKHVAEEAADVTYFMMVRCAAAGVSVEDIEKELNMRSLKLKRRPGNAKVERIAAGDRILGAGRQTTVAKMV